jgi:macrolide transport system ATP-binding/permease protein
MTQYLSIAEISKAYGPNQVLNKVSFTLNDAQRIGLVGANGVGKSTLLKIITGEIEADGGTFTIRPAIEVGYLAQTLSKLENNTLVELISESMSKLLCLERELRDLEEQMTVSDGETLESIMDDYADATDKFERYGGYEMDSRVETVLSGLNIADIARERQFATLSGGEKARFGLALLLLQAPDILLLDEPTNHLDIDSLLWLEGYLQAYSGAMLIVSHDRQFLNNTVSAIIEIDEHSHKTKRYSGNYDDYHQAKKQEQRKWQVDFAQQQEEIKELRMAIKVTARRNDNYRARYAFSDDKFIKNFKKAGHEATISKRVRSAEERLKRIEESPIPRPPEALHFDPDFDPQTLRGCNPLHVNEISKSFGERCILDSVSFSLGLNSRVVLVGPNGAGKSTLLKILVGQESADSGEVYINPAVNIGYVDQELRLFNPEIIAFDTYSEGIEMTEQQLKAFLIGTGLFRYEDLSKRVGQLSSGQRRKLQIARLIVDKTNLLILDEPTNYVSFDVLEELEEALRHFPGTIIAASHDRRFIQQFNGQVWSLQDGQLLQQ